MNAGSMSQRKARVTMSQQALIHGTMLPSSSILFWQEMFDLVSLQQTTMLYGNAATTDENESSQKDGDTKDTERRDVSASGKSAK
jgi:hypothetical protein